jgi:hypothetical protein
MAASIGANNAPTTPMVNGKLINSLPDFSVMVILLTFVNSG